MSKQRKDANVEYPVTVTIGYQEKLSRLSTFFRIILVIPQWLVLYILGIAVSVVVFFSWFAILFTGKYPKWAFFFVSGYVRWYGRVRSYFCLLTDKYPPFNFT